MSILTTANLTALRSLVEHEIDHNASCDEINPNEAYLYALLGKLTVLQQESELNDAINADRVNLSAQFEAGLI